MSPDESSLGSSAAELLNLRKDSARLEFIMRWRGTLWNYELSNRDMIDEAMSNFGESFDRGGR